MVVGAMVVGAMMVVGAIVAAESQPMLDGLEVVDKLDEGGLCVAGPDA